MLLHDARDFVYAFSHRPQFEHQDLQEALVILQSTNEGNGSLGFWLQEKGADPIASAQKLLEEHSKPVPLLGCDADHLCKF